VFQATISITLTTNLIKDDTQPSPGECNM